MARYEHLPIYKKAFELNLYFDQTVRNFSRYNKYTVGKELRETARLVVKHIYRANNETGKLKNLLELRELLEELKLTLNICREIKAFSSFNSFSVAMNLVIDISKQNEGWIKSLSK